ncbi:hypothetical protein BJX63DRAFT_352038 [Aspergillus granulosus]|uniref:Uncharacterized protein n=1 Tax=Aspergillus granulosus TaxID=176169 RepID=A0ABR4H2D1_9EURO
MTSSTSTRANYYKLLRTVEVSLQCLSRPCSATVASRMPCVDALSRYLRSVLRF